MMSFHLKQWLLADIQSAKLSLRPGIGLSFVDDSSQPIRNRFPDHPSFPPSALDDPVVADVYKVDIIRKAHLTF